jgi:hypothetical protein
MPWKQNDQSGSVPRRTRYIWEQLRANLDSAVVLLKEMALPLNKGAFALVELLSGLGAPSGLHARSHSISSIEQLPCKQDVAGSKPASGIGRNRSNTGI